MRAQLSLPSLCACFVLAASPLACSGGAASDPIGAGDTTSQSNDGGAGNDNSATAGAASTSTSTVDLTEEENPCLGDNPPTDLCQLVAEPSCGDAELNQETEVCDDGNTLPGDGCNGICLVEPNYVCPTPGQPCELTFECGNGVREPGEVCDDGNAADGDGCDATCETVDPNYRCPLEGQPCERIVFCGDGRIGGDESCEDDDAAEALEAGDGCDAECHVETGWICRVPGEPCEVGPMCGDSVVTPGIGEACDDGNTAAGDGCAADCSYMEDGWLCATPGQPCENLTICGDGRVSGDEQCDDADDDPNDGCDDCTLTTGWQCPFPGAPCMPMCGDGINLNNAEICDDGNTVDGDGCSSLCEWEDGFACTGEAGAYVCVPTVCGDGNVAGTESCDDGNNDMGDGCTPLCNIEPACEAGGCTSTCGDGLLLGSEECDDGNNRIGDGCSDTCQVEPGNECEQPEIGESMTVPIVYRDFDESHPDFEPGAIGCEDPNPGLVEGTLGTAGKPVQAVLSDDACSRANALDEWYTDSANSTTIVDSLTLWLTDDGASYVNRYGENGEPFVITIDTGNEQGGYGTSKETCDATCTQRTRDNLQCENVCRPEHDQVDQTTRELTQIQDQNEDDLLALADLEADVAAAEAAAATCDTDCTATATDPLECETVCAAEIAAVAAAELAYETALTPLEPILLDMETLEAEIVAQEAIAAQCDADCAADFATLEAECQAACTPCSYNAAQWCIGGVITPIDGNPLFFPIDGAGQTPVAQYSDATIPEPVYYGNWQEDPSGELHNFHFTSEVRFWFQFDANPEIAQILNFTGDDDVWVFINNQLVVDLGGIHMPVEGAVNITQAAATLGLTDGNVYEIVVFQAERQTTGSSYRLTLSGFNAAHSDCGPICGDGVVSPGEQCDDGTNLGGYNNCNPDCTRGEYCGDGILQDAEGEQCDNGVNLTPYGDTGCAPGCVAVPFCGDALIQGEFGERCDDGVNDGSYEGCAADCQRAGFCGDGNTDAEHGEECDDGLNNGAYGTCAPGCVLGPRCGDGVLEEDWGETCDDGNNLPGDGCSAECTAEGICGDGFVDAAAGEECDDGDNTGVYGGCAPGCFHGPRCGDGVTQPEHEECDGGPDARVMYGECAPGCILGPHCGDGTLHDAYEDCDDGNTDPHDGCSPGCKIEIAIPI